VSYATVFISHIETGLKKTGRRRQDIELSSTVFVVPTDDSEKTKAYEAGARQQVSFYASTPPYKVVMDIHGWGDTAGQLSYLAARGRWDEMPDLITDEMLDTFVIYGTWTEIPAKIKAKYAGGLLDRVSYYFPFIPGENDAGWQATIAGFKSN
jgi:alkanesulfonate monooxygenase SsuD/methylene tetrahydromethanopterin reductase-like flavin-dependent oxidoreductase (luciferase family)